MAGQKDEEFQNNSTGNTSVRRGGAHVDFAELMDTIFN